MHTLDRRRGAEISTLLAELNKLPSGTRTIVDGARFTRLRRAVDQRDALLRLKQQTRRALVAERDWVLSEVKGYRQGLALGGGEDGRLQRRLDERRATADSISREIDEIDRLIDDIEAEIVGWQDEMVDILRRSVDDADEKLRRAARARRQRQSCDVTDVGRFEMWSPVAVRAYRAWNPTREGFFGVRQRWRRPSLTAVCGAEGDLPHTDGRCAKVAFGCGIYAAKSLEDFLESAGVEPAAKVAVGLVGLEGKVVEHERGYRAEIATVLALAVVDEGIVRLVGDADELRDLFSEPTVVRRVGSIPVPTPTSTGELRATIAEFFDRQGRRYESWISASPSE